jgi:aerobic carbon-monoxide dehydrogenase medium subunit
MLMIPGSFAYHRPKSLEDAVHLLADLGEEARALAGGHSLIPMMKLRRLSISSTSRASAT